MKNSVLTTIALLAFGMASSQTDPKKPADQKAKMDTTTIDKTNPESMKTSETVKTKKHDKTTRKNKTAKDSIVDNR